MLARAHTLHWLLAHHQATKALLAAAAFDIIIVVTLTPRDMSNTTSREAAFGPSPAIPGRLLLCWGMDAAHTC